MPHVVLLGDSILDNAAYVGRGPAVVDQLRSRLPRDWRVTLLARDGAIALDVLKQLPQLPEDATHLVLSAGGNDALASAALVNSPPPDSATMLAELIEVQNRFQQDYRQLLRAIRQTGRPFIGCTIYDAIPGLLPAERLALSLFNDVITRELLATRDAFQTLLMDLRLLCTESRDFSELSPIEPSEIGGARITQKLQQLLLCHDFDPQPSVAEF